MKKYTLIALFLAGFAVNSHALDLNEAKAKASELAEDASTIVALNAAYTACIAKCLTSSNRNECQKDCEIVYLKEKVKALEATIAKLQSREYTIQGK